MLGLPVVMALGKQADGANACYYHPADGEGGFI